MLEAQSSIGHAEGNNGNDLLEYARIQIRSTIDEARQAVWNLRENSGAISNLAPQLQGISQQVSHEFGIPVKFQVEGKPFGLDQSTVHDVLMVTREALYNAVRHGQPRRVQVEVCYEPQRCLVKIGDDGTGFEYPPQAGASNGHYGLIGMRERVERFGGTFLLKSRIGAGTNLAIMVPQKPLARGQDEALEMRL